jgi:hypothetical protein
VEVVQHPGHTALFNHEVDPWYHLISTVRQAHLSNPPSNARKRHPSAIAQATLGAHVLHDDKQASKFHLKLAKWYTMRLQQLQYLNWHFVLTEVLTIDVGTIY